MPRWKLYINACIWQLPGAVVPLCLERLAKQIHKNTKPFAALLVFFGWYFNVASWIASSAPALELQGCHTAVQRSTTSHNGLCASVSMLTSTMFWSAACSGKRWLLAQFSHKEIVHSWCFLKIRKTVKRPLTAAPCLLDSSFSERGTDLWKLLIVWILIAYDSCTSISKCFFFFSLHPKSSQFLRLLSDTNTSWINALHMGHTSASHKHSQSQFHLRRRKVNNQSKVTQWTCDLTAILFYTESPLTKQTEISNTNKSCVHTRQAEGGRERMPPGFWSHKRQ